MLSDHVSVSINASRLPIKVDCPFPEPTNVAACFAWLQVFQSDANDVIAAEEEHETLSAKARKELNSLYNKATFALANIDAQWISEPHSESKDGFVLKPLTVGRFTGKLFRYGKRVLLMSATVLDAKKMAEDLGIEDYAFISAPCPFPVENRQVVVSNLNMTKAHRSNSWPLMVAQVALILEGHHDEKGLILTPSNEMLNYLLEHLPQKHSDRLILARGKSRMIDYQRHLDSQEPTVLAASGFWEGADLKDDYSRFQVLPALPRPYWGGQVAARAKIDPVWYRMKTYQQLLQGLGRSVRGDQDRAVSYVLDGELKREAERSDTLLPQWFREALVFA